MRHILTFKIQFYYFVILLIIAIGSTFFISYSYFKLHQSIANNAVNENVNNNNTCNYTLKRLDGYTFIKPLFDADKSCETGNLVPLKQRLLTVLNRYKLAGDIVDASIYLRDFTDGDFMTINDESKFNAGSLLSLPLLIAYLRIDDDIDGYIENKKIKYSNYNSTTTTHPKGWIYKSRNYNVKELLTSMIVYGDTIAQQLLLKNIDDLSLKRVFTDINIECPTKASFTCNLTPREYSRFLISLYGATYLSIKNSEYAIELLNNAKENNLINHQKLVKTKAVYKYGGITTGIQNNFHTSGIIFLPNEPYTITVMTKGKDFTKLKSFVNEVTALIYKDMGGIPD